MLARDMVAHARLAFILLDNAAEVMMRRDVEAALPGNKFLADATDESVQQDVGHSLRLSWRSGERGSWVDLVWALVRLDGHARICTAAHRSSPVPTSGWPQRRQKQNDPARRR